ncbi:MAG: hypothetical protein GF364_21925 [Candidatus Lokiarchaeota archaeon]|nr:hypothetical protein [Candidatus Lokiarchaeota archaeon]
MIVDVEIESSEIAVGFITMWSGLLDNIPEGWALCNGSDGTPDLRSRFLYGVGSQSEIGNLGGLNSHNHTYSQVPEHTHSINDPAHEHTINVSNRGVYDSPQGGPSVHSLDGAPSVYTTDLSDPQLYCQYTGSNDCSTDNSTDLPPYYELAFIMKTEVTEEIPQGLIMIWADPLSSVPDGWLVCNGSLGTPNLTSRFLRGVENSIDPGNVGGYTEHNHTYSMVPRHNHLITGDSHIHNLHSTTYYLKPGGVSNAIFSLTTSGILSYTNYNDTDITLDEAGSPDCETDNASSMPPYYEVAFIIKDNSINILPKNVIGIWADESEPIPGGFDYCNGLLGTPNFTNRFLLGAPAGLNPGSKGGFLEHNHTYTEIPSHTHIINSPPDRHFFDIEWVYTPDSGPIMAEFYDENGEPNAVTTENQVGASIENEGIATCMTDNASSLPPYYSVRFIQHTNCQPEASAVGFIDTTLYTDEDIVASYIYDDNDSDSESGSQIRWYKNNVYQPQFDDQGTIPAIWTNKSQDWNYTIRPNDGKELGNLVWSSKVTILNSLPEATTINLNPSLPYTSDDLVINYDYSDADGDDEGDTHIRWYKNNVHQSMFDDQTSVPAIWINKTEKWNATIEPYDGEEYGEVRSTTVQTILNSKPEAYDLQITPAVSYADEDLELSYSYYDADGDAEVGTHISWFKNGESMEDYTDLTIVPASELIPGDDWHATVLPTDGTELGDLVTTGIVHVIVDTKPVIGIDDSDISYRDGSIGNSLVFTITDEYVQDPTYDLYRNGTQIATDVSWSSNSPITIDIDGLSQGYWNFTLVAEDGYGNVEMQEVRVHVQPPRSLILDLLPYLIGGAAVAIVVSVIIVKKKGASDTDREKPSQTENISENAMDSVISESSNISSDSTTPEGENQEIIEDKALVCPECGKVLSAGNKICPKCGNKMED